VVLIPPNPEEEWITSTSTCPVGKKVEAIRCEIHGVVPGVELAVQHYQSHTCVNSKATESVIILCGCMSAVDMITVFLKFEKVGSVSEA